MAVRAQDVLRADLARGPATVGVQVVAAALAALGAAVAAARLTGLAEVPRLEEFTLVFVSIVVEALPFVLAGALVSALLAVFVAERTFARIGRLPVAVQVPGALACSLAFPVCECGSVPVARRLIARGVHPSAGLAFMLAAPIVNPVVLASTWIAYGGWGLGFEMTAARAACGLAIALVAGLLLGRFVARPAAAAATRHEHDHAGGTTGKLGALGEHVAADALFTGRFLVLGAAVAALLQTAVPTESLSRFAELPVVGAASLMVLAVLLSLCSESDAFVAVSFTSFTPGAQLAFLGLGPVFDAKLAVLYAASFRRVFAPALLAIAFPLLLIAAAVFDGLVR